MDFIANIDVADLEEGIRFYQAAFRLRVGRRFATYGVEMLGGPVPIYLLAKDAGTLASDVTAQVRCYDRHWTPVHLDFIVTDIESAVRDALAAGARLEAAISATKWGKLAVMADPFGHGFCFIEFLGRGYDEIAD